MKKFFKKLLNFLKMLFTKGGASWSGGTSDVSVKITVEFSYGGFDFTKAKEDKSAVIENLVVNGNAMKYSWRAGNLRGWGLSDTQADAIAVFAVKDSSGKWRGGKFDWISKSRTSRDFKNIQSGYGGWPRNAVDSAKGYAFCICSKDGKHRTNWIATNKKVYEARIRGGHTATEKMDR